MQWIFLSVFIKRIKAIKFFMKDKGVPKRKKLVIILGILFLISPINLITVPVFGLGLIDDIILWSFIIYYFKDELDKYWLGEKEVNPKQREALKGKDIIDDVDFEIEAVDGKEIHPQEETQKKADQNKKQGEA